MCACVPFELKLSIASLFLEQWILDIIYYKINSWWELKSGTWHKLTWPVAEFALLGWPSADLAPWWWNKQLQQATHDPSRDFLIVQTSTSTQALKCKMHSIMFNAQTILLTIVPNGVMEGATNDRNPQLVKTTFANLQWKNFSLNWKKSFQAFTQMAIGQ